MDELYEKLWWDAGDLMKFTGQGRSWCYERIKLCNKELEEMGKITISGKVPRRFVMEKFYV